MSRTMGAAMLIGELAHHTGTTTKTLRFYEDEGLLPEPGRTPSGYRDYPLEALDRVTFIRDAQGAGFTLRQIGQRYVSVVRTNLRQLDAVPQVYRLLAAGEPVTVECVASEGGWSVEDLWAEFARHPGTDWDEEGRIVGFNLTLRPTPHTFTFDGRRVYVFCADGALELPSVLGRPGVIESPCPITGQRIRVEVTPSRVVRVDPPEAVVSKVSPTEAVADVRAEICGLGHFISSPAAAADWLAHYPQGQLDPVADDFEIVRQAMTELGWAADQGEQVGP